MKEIVMVRGTLDGEIKTTTVSLSDIDRVTPSFVAYPICVILHSGEQYKCDGFYFK